MKNVSKVFVCLVLLTPLSLLASDSYKEQAIRQLAQEISRKPENLHLIIRNLTEQVKGVEQAVGKPLEVRLALQIARCSELAAHPDDPGKYGKGVQFKNIEPQKAIKACSNAYGNGGRNIGLVLSTLSRAYNKAKDYRNSLYYAKRAVEAGYPFGDVMMALHYSYGDGVKKDNKAQFQWYRKAASKGITSAMRSTASNYLEGTGTTPKLDEAYFWATSAIELNDGKGFYFIGRVLEEKAKRHSQPEKMLRLARESYEIAVANSARAAREIKRVNKQLLPNKIHDDSVLFKPKFKGSKVNGQFHRSEANGYWYAGEKRLSHEGNSYLYARTSVNNSTLSIWYKKSSPPGVTGWYVDFLYGGSNEIVAFNAISVTSKISGKTHYIDLDLSDPRVQKLPATYRLTGRLSFRDIQLLTRGTQVKLYYKTASKHTPTYTLALNDPEIQTARNSQNAEAVLSQMVREVRKLNKRCCDGPEIEPLGEHYIALVKICDDKALTRSIGKKVIHQKCHQLFKNTTYSSDLVSYPFKFNQTRLLKEVDRVWNSD